MKKLYIGVVVLLVLLKTSDLNAQQEIHFTQYIFNTLSVNPAYAGYKEQWYAQMALRNQWAGVQGAPKTAQFSIDGIVSPISRNVGLGLQLNSDKMGPQSSTSLYLNYAYRIRLNEEDTQRLSFGLAAGLGQFGVDGTLFSTVDNNDLALLYSNESIWKWNLRLGAYYYAPRWYAGISLMNILEGEDNAVFNSDLGRYNVVQRKHMYIIAGTIMDISPAFKLRPSFLIMDDFKGPTSIDLSAMLIFNQRFWIGGSYRTGMELLKRDYVKYSAENLHRSNALSVITQIYISENLRVGYSYDYLLNTFGNQETGSHEISLGYTIPLRGRRLVSPRFF